MQAYLKREILEANYDTAAFLEFISEKKTGGENLENWRLEELQHLVTVFKQEHSEVAHQPEGAQESPEKELEQEQIETAAFGEILIEGMQDMVTKLEETTDPSEEPVGEIEAEETDPKKAALNRLMKTANDFNASNYNFNEKIACHKMTANKIGQLKKLKVSITGERLVKGGFFSSSYTTYQIITTGDNGTLFEVERRFSQFDVLKQKLFRDFPGVYIPPIARKQLKNFEEGFLKNRFDTLKRFLQALCSHEVLRHSPHFEAFVTIKDEAEYSRACVAIDKKACPYQFFSNDFSIYNFNSGFKANQLKTLTGEYEAKINKSYHTLAISSEQYFRDADPVLQQLKSKLIEVDVSFDKTVSLVAEASTLIGKFGSLTDKYRTSTKDIQDTWDSFSTVIAEYQATIDNLGSLASTQEGR